MDDNIDNQEEMDQISTIALLIDDLSSEDPSAKLHSIQRLVPIAQLLGTERTSQELVPMLTELIDKIDCNPELMMNLAEQLGNLTNVLETNEYIKTLIDPLEVLIGNDDQVVRSKAVISMKKVGRLLDAKTIKDIYLPLLKRQRKGDLFSMRISACFLYSDIYEKLDFEQREMTRKKFLKLSKDDTPMVRRGAAQSIPALAAHIGNEQAKEFLLPIIKALLEDSNDSVKINAVQSSIDVAKSVNDSNLIKETILPAFNSACQNRYSWRLRFAVAENAGLLCNYLNQTAIDDEIIGYYELLLRDGEPEVRSEAISKLPLVVKDCSSYQLVDKILPILKEQMSSDTSQHVKGAMASAICEMTQYIERDKTIDYIMPTIFSLLKDDSVTEVRVSLLENISLVAKSIGEESCNEYLIPEIEKLSKDQKWRVRLATVSYLPHFLEFTSRKLFTERIEPIFKSYLEDSVHQVRMEAVKCMIKMKTQWLDQKWLENIIAEKFDEFYKHDKFTIRIHTLFSINEFAKEISDKFLNDKLYKTYMKPLSTDPVPNIRFNFAKTAQQVYPRLSNSNKMDCAEKLKKMSESDTDFDAKYYAAKALQATQIGQ